MIASPTLHDVSHGFTGVNEGDFRSNESCGPALVARLGGKGPLHSVVQVHGRAVLRAPDQVGRGAEADALIAVDAGVAIAVRVADCVPVLLAAPGGVAAIHAGWRGTAANVVRASLAALVEATGSPPASIRAVIGPSIRGCCYHVGPEVRAGVANVAPGQLWREGNCVDLAIANREILLAEGVNVEVIGPCTHCSAEYWSHRRDGDRAGRQVAAIVVPAR